MVGGMCSRGACMVGVACMAGGVHGKGCVMGGCMAGGRAW